MRYFFEPGAAEVNIVPVGTMDLTSPDLVLPHAPDIHGNNSFGTPAMYSLDFVQLGKRFFLDERSDSP